MAAAAVARAWAVPFSLPAPFWLRMGFSRITRLLAVPGALLSRLAWVEMAADQTAARARCRTATMAPTADSAAVAAAVRARMDWAQEPAAALARVPAVATAGPTSVARED